ncbi:MAG: N-acetylglucosamine-6-phosphate deacetylase [Paracoccaceae bacterium]
MSDAAFALSADVVFDGERSHDRAALVVEHGRVAAVLPQSEVPAGLTQQWAGAMIAPGFVDLQVNGGGGVMFNDTPDVATLRRMADAHARFGTTAMLPTLITDRPEVTKAAVAAVRDAVAAGVAGIAGLHLEGPHLSIGRKGAHDPALIRPMGPEDLAMLVAAARDLPALLVTVAVEAVTPEQIAALKQADAVVSLGHSGASFAEAEAAVAAGARAVTHLFNAMSPLGNREPGLVGAALAQGELSAGVIADGFHVHPASLGAALRAKVGPGGLFLVTDAMATVGSELTEFTLNGRRILRRGGRLTLEDGTLAGADLDMMAAVHFAAETLGLGIERALAMAGAVPARLMGLDRLGWLGAGSAADFVVLDAGWTLQAVWRGGEKLTP